MKFLSGILIFFSLAGLHTVVVAQTWSASGGSLHTTAPVGIGTTTPQTALDVNGQISLSGSLNLDVGDLVLKRTSHPYGYVVRPNQAGFKKLQFAVVGGGPLEEIALNSAVSWFNGKLGVGLSNPVSPLHVRGSRISIINPGEARLHLWNEAPVAEWVLGQRNATSHNFNISTSTAGNENDIFTITPDGKVGIGIVGSTARLTIESAQEEVGRFRHISAANSRLVVANTTGAINLGIGGINQNGYLWSSTGNLFVGDDGAAPSMFIKGMSGGSVGIGTTNPGTNKLAVEGTIAARKVKVTQVSPWPDYVFGERYKLMPLEKLAEYIQLHKHLPEMPDAGEVEQNGIDLGDNQAALLKKIEELTLYVIQLKQEVEQLKRNHR